MSAPSCSCGRPVADQAYLCQRCGDRLEQRLAEVPALAEDLQITRTRQSKTGGSGIGVVSRNSERPLPWDERASLAVAAVHSALVAILRRVQTERGRPPLGPVCALCTHDSCDHVRAHGRVRDTLPSLAAFGLRNLRWLRHHPDAGVHLDDLDRAVRRARAVTDRAPDLVFVGICSAPLALTNGQPEPDAPAPSPIHGPIALCPADVYAVLGHDTVTCRLCSTEHVVAERQARLLAVAGDQLATAQQLSAALSRLGSGVTASSIRGWAHRGRLVAHGTDDDERPLYRVSEVEALVRERDTRAAARVPVQRVS